MRVTTLGMLAVDGVPVRGDRLVALVRALLDARGRPVPVSTLIDAVWDGEVPRDATGAMQALVSRVRRLGLPVAAAPGGGYLLPTQDLAIDAVEASALVERARRALRAGDPTAARRHGDEARALLPAAPDPDEATVRALVHDVATVRAQAALAGAGGTDAGDERDLRLLATAVPPDEEAAALLLRLLAVAGRQAEALEFVDALRRELAERYGADPAPALAAAHVALLRGELAPYRATDPQPAVRPRASLLPAGWRRAATAMLGRDTELVAVTGELDSAPLVTIVGPGGAGKTRFAAEIARRTAAGGQTVRVAELAGVRTPAQVAGAVATAVGRGEAVSARDLVEGEFPAHAPSTSDTATAGDPVRRAARDLSGLVVLDNCEHVLDAAAQAATQILAVAPKATVLATSRAPLGLAGEVVHRLRALADEDALALLDQRARAGGATLGWLRSRALELCHRLDNLPLAIELAAARLRHMPIDDVLAGLADRFELLDEALRGLPERHASLWSMVDWSHDLLPDEVRRLWWRLSVIPAAFTVETAAGVAAGVAGGVTVETAAGVAGGVAGHGARAEGVRDGLATLVEQSLLGLGQGEDGAPRYRMLETVREYGEVRLDATGGRDDAMRGLVAWARSRASTLAADFIGPGQVPAFAGCAADADTLAAALRWAMDSGDEVSAVDIAVALFHLWSVQGRHTEVVDWSRRLLRVDDPLARSRSAIAKGSHAGVPLPDADRLAWTLTMVGVNATVMGSRTRLAAVCRRALRVLFAERGNLISPRAAALARVPTSVDVADLQSAMSTAQALVDHADLLVRAFGFFLRAAVRENEGEHEPAQADYLAAYRGFEVAGDQWMMGLAAQGVANRLSTSGLAGAEEWMRRAAAHLSIVGAEEDARSLQVQLDVQLALAGDEPAVQRVAEAATTSESLDAAIASSGLAEIAIRHGRHDEAVQHVQAMACLPSSSLAQAAVMVRASAAAMRLWAAAVAPDSRDDAEADRFTVAQLVAAEPDALSTGDIPALGAWALAGAELAAHRGQYDQARELWAIAVRLGARVILPFQDGYGPRLTDALGGPEHQQALLLPWRGRSVAAITARVRELAGQLLGT